MKGVIYMAETTNINIRIDKDIKEQADVLFSELGMNMTTAFNIFIRQSLRQGGIPFEITTSNDPFYSITNQTILRKSIADLENKKGLIYKTIDELEAMENE